jgi:hypothetical protein
MVHPEIRQFLAQDRLAELARDARHVQIEAPATLRRVDDAEVALRLCAVGDDAALERLAELEGRPLAQGRFVVAEVGGAVVAALPLAGGAAYADPFAPTAHLVPLLRLRAEQLARPAGQRRSLLRHWSLIRGSIHA